MTPPNASTFDSVSAYLTWDHDELDSMLTDVVPIVEDEEWERAEDHFIEFRDRLRRHIRVEEELLFPLFIRTYGNDAPIRVMLTEHREIEARITAMAAALNERNGERFANEMHRLSVVLGNHNVKEEGVLYPAIDRSLGADGRRRVVDQMHAI